MDALAILLREALVTTALLCLPVLLAATVVGFLVAVLQAATSIQEQTLSLLPKLLAVGAVIVFGGESGMRLCAALFARALALVPLMVR